MGGLSKTDPPIAIDSRGFMAKCGALYYLVNHKCHFPPLFMEGFGCLNVGFGGEGLVFSLYKAAKRA